MSPLIAYCGIDCEVCDAYIATLNNNDNLRKEIAKKWSEMFHAEIPANTINCTGCRIDGSKIGHCYECEIRACTQTKNFNTCGDCPELNTCPTIGHIFQQVPGAKERLLDQ